jgi:hypothetical protein
MKPNLVRNGFPASVPARQTQALTSPSLSGAGSVWHESCVLSLSETL